MATRQETIQVSVDALAGALPAGLRLVEYRTFLLGGPTPGNTITFGLVLDQTGRYSVRSQTYGYAHRDHVGSLGCRGARSKDIEAVRQSVASDMAGLVELTAGWQS